MPWRILAWCVVNWKVFPASIWRSQFRTHSQEKFLEICQWSSGLRVPGGEVGTEGFTTIETRSQFEEGIVRLPES